MQVHAGQMQSGQMHGGQMRRGIAGRGIAGRCGARGLGTGMAGRGGIRALAAQGRPGLSGRTGQGLAQAAPLTIACLPYLPSMRASWRLASTKSMSRLHFLLQ